MDEDKLLKVLGCIELRTNDILQMQDIAQNPRLNFIKKEVSSELIIAEKREPTKAGRNRRFTGCVKHVSARGAVF